MGHQYTHSSSVLLPCVIYAVSNSYLLSDYYGQAIILGDVNLGVGLSKGLRTCILNNFPSAAGAADAAVLGTIFWEPLFGD